MESTDNIVIEHLKALRNELRDFKTDVRNDLDTIKSRLSSIEVQMAHLHGDNATISHRMDVLDGRIERMSRRLELSDTP